MAHFQLGELYRKLNRYNEALQAYKTTIGYPERDRYLAGGHTRIVSPIEHSFGSDASIMTMDVTMRRASPLKSSFRTALHLHASLLLTFTSPL